MTKVSNTLHVERAKKRITQKDLAKEIGTSRQTIHAIEAGKFQPGGKIMLKLGRFFGIPVEEIFKLEE